MTSSITKDPGSGIRVITSGNTDLRFGVKRLEI